MILSTGKEINPYYGVIGINENMDITGGYDEYFRDTQCPENCELTNEEIIEIANYMIRIWTKFKKDIEQYL